MPKRRDLVKMTPEEQHAFMLQQKSIQVATINHNGWPHLTTLWFALDDEKHIIIETFTKSQKIVNLRRNPRITLLLEDGEIYNKLRGLVIYGNATLIDDVDEVHEHSLKVLLRNNNEQKEEDLRAASLAMAAKKTIIKVVPERVVSWDHSKLDGIY